VPSSGQEQRKLGQGETRKAESVRKRGEAQNPQAFQILTRHTRDKESGVATLTDVHELYV